MDSLRSMTRLSMREQAARAALMFALLSWRAYSLRDINDVSIIEDGAIQILLPEENCDFQIEAVALSGGQSFLPRTLKIRECTTIVVISNLGGEGVLIQVPGGEDTTEMVYSLIKKPANGSTKDICRDGVDEAVELDTPLVPVPGKNFTHPAKIYIHGVSEKYSWPTRTTFCNDERIQLKSCSNASCIGSTCVTVTLSDPVFLYVAYDEKVCNENSSNVTCEAIRTHFDGTQKWYRQHMARHCVVVADAEQCLPNCKSLYNATESSTVYCNFTTGLCRRLPNQKSPDVSSTPTRPSLHTTSPNNSTNSTVIPVTSAPTRPSRNTTSPSNSTSNTVIPVTFVVLVTATVVLALTV